jgi:hypothetical protein
VKKEETKEIDNKELERRRKSLKTLKIMMMVLDVVALVILAFQIYLKDVAYYSYVILIICNVITFMAKPVQKDR